MKRKLAVVTVTVLALATLGLAQDRDQPSARSQERITREVRHELLMLPYFGVFDYIAFKVDGGTVTLLGQDWVHDSAKKVDGARKEVSTKVGGDVKLVSFVRFSLGEGIEKKADDLAAEVAKMTGA